jgi:hypothetical protein
VKRAQPSPTTLVEAADPAQAFTLTYSNRRITTFRARIFGRLPAERAAAVTRRLDEFVASRMTKPVTSRPEQGGVVITVGTRDVFAVLPEDLDELAGETLEARTREAVANTSLALDEAVEARPPRDLINAILSSLGATVLFVGVLLFVRRLRRALAARLMATAERQLGRLPGKPVQAILPRDRILTFVGHLVNAGVPGILLVLASTRRLVATLIWVFALIEAYPFVPGSDTDAFKSVSVLIGLMVSLGSAGLVNQVISSFTLTYSRALHPGDFVKIGSVEGIVMQVGVLSTKIMTPAYEGDPERPKTVPKDQWFSAPASVHGSHAIGT